VSAALIFDIRLISRDVRLAPAGEIAGGRWFLRPTFAHFTTSEAEFDTVRIRERQRRRKRNKKRSPFVIVFFSRVYSFRRYFTNLPTRRCLHVGNVRIAKVHRASLISPYRRRDNNDSELFRRVASDETLYSANIPRTRITVAARRLSTKGEPGWKSC